MSNEPTYVHGELSHVSSTGDVIIMYPETTTDDIIIGSSPISIDRGGTGATTQAAALESLGAASKTHTHNNMTGATSNTAGISGLVPAPSSGNQNAYLKGNATWGFPLNAIQLTNEDLDSVKTEGFYWWASANGTVTNMPLDTLTAFNLEVIRTGSNNYMQILTTSSVLKKQYRRWFYGNAWTSWEEILITDTTYDVMTAASSNAAGASGLVPAPGKGRQGAYLRGDGAWVVPENTTYTLTQDATNGHIITFTPSSGVATTITIPDNNTTYNNATTTVAGLMSASDKSKLDNIASGANNITVDTSLSSTSTNPVQNKVINTALSGKANTSHTHTSTDITDTLPISKGGTGATDRGTAYHDLSTTMISTANTSLDDYTVSGWYYFPENVKPTDSPTNSKGYLYVVIPASSITQLWFTQDMTKMYARTCISNTWSNWVENKLTDTTYNNATTSVAGLMSAADKTKLDGIATGATNVSVDSALNSSSTNPVQNKVINNALAGKSDTNHTHTVVNGHTVESDVPSNAVFTDTTYNIMTGASSTTAGTLGLVPTPAKGKQESYLRGDGTWVVPTNTTYTLTQDVTDGHIITFTPSSGNATTITIPDNNTTYNNATTTVAGLMSASDKSKLDNIASGANNITVDSSLSSTSTNPVQNKVINTALGNKLNTSLKGTANGLAELDSNGKVPANQLPSFVDDIIEGYYYNSKFYSDSGHTTEIASESGKIYTDLSTNKIYRWSGSTYVVISDSIVLGESSNTAYRGDRGKIAYDHSQLTSGNPHNVSKSDLGLDNVENKSSATIRGELTKSNVTTALGYTPPTTDTTYNNATTTVAGLMSAADKTKLDGIATGANKITVDTALSSSSTNPVQNKVINTALAGKSDTSHTHTVVNGHTVQSDVPANAIFTDTTYSSGDGISINNNIITNTGYTKAIQLTNEDLNDVRTEGFYWWASANGTVTNIPVDTLTAFNLEVIRSGTSNYMQILTTSSVLKKQYRRWFYGNAWTAWEEILITDTTYDNATTSVAGLMSASDKSKLDGIATGANNITVDSSLSSTSTNPVQNKVINTALAGKSDTNHTHTVVNGHTVESDVPSNAVFTDTTYTAGNGINIDNFVISNTGYTKATQLSNEDLDSVKTEGFYWWVSANGTVTNMPLDTLTAFNLEVIRTGSNNYMQILTTSSVAKKQYRRWCYGSAWTAWEEILITDTTYDNATTSVAGLMSADDKTKLDGIATGATNVSVDSALNSSSTNPVQNKVINNALASKSNTNHTHNVVNGHTVESDVPANAVFTDTTYTAGNGISIDNTVITNTGYTKAIQLTNEDLDSVRTEGFYWWASANGTVTNMPLESLSAFNLEVIRSGNSNYMQLLTTSSILKKQYRRWYNGSWTEWEEILITDTTYNNASTSVAGLMSASDKTKLDGIATGANNITVDSALSSSSTNPVQNKVINTALNNKADTNHTHDNATTSVAGLMSAADKSKLDSIEIDTSLSSTSTNPVQNKVINTALNNKANTSHTHTSTDITDTLPISKGGTGATDKATAYHDLSTTMISTANTSLDDYKSSGWYYFPENVKPSDSPTNSKGYLYVVIPASSVTQLWFTQDMTKMYARTFISNTWSNWVENKLTDTTYDNATTSVAGLMSAADKIKLDGIATGANNITVDSSLSSSSTNPVQNKVINTALSGKSDTNHTHDNATTSVAGLMSAADKTKLDGIDNNANKITIDTSLSSTSTNPVQNKVINTALNNKADTSHTHDNATTSTSGLMSASDKTKLDGIETGANNITVDTALSSSSTNPVQNKVINTALNNKLNTSLKGTANGLAELDSNGKVPSTQLPSFVDDIIEGYYYNSKFYSDSGHTTEITSENGKIYTDLSTNKIYRWSGSTYVVISDTITLGESSNTAYRGDRGKIAYDHSQLTSGNPHNVSKSDIGLANVENKSSATIRGELTKSNVTTALGYTPPTTDTTYTAGSGISIDNAVITNTGYTKAIQLTNEDLNDVRTEGFYWWASANGTVTNIPLDTLTAFNLEVIRSGGTNYMQLLTTSSVLKKQYRRWYNGSWTTWEEILITDTTYNDATTSIAGLMSASDKTKLDGIATGANNITVDSALSSSSTNPVQNKVINTALSGKSDTNHTHTVVNGHTVESDVPSNAVFTDTTYNNATTSIAGLMSAADKTKLDGIATGANNITVDSALSSSSINPVQNNIITNALTSKSDLSCIDITGQTVDLDSYTLNAAGSPCRQYLIQKTTNGGANVSNSPITGIEYQVIIELLRRASASDYITKQTFVSSSNGSSTNFTRFCKNGTWTSWLPEVKFSSTPTSGKVVIADGARGNVKTSEYTIAKSVPSDAVFTDTTYSNMTAASASAAGTSGLVPAPGSGKQNYYLKGNATWDLPLNAIQLTNEDLNTVKTEGFYWWASANGTVTNMPVDDLTAFNLEVIRTGNTNYMQILTTSSTLKKKYRRWCTGGTTYTSWTEIKETDTTYNNATTSTSGLMSTDDKTKLDGFPDNLTSRKSGFNAGTDSISIGSNNVSSQQYTVSIGTDNTVTGKGDNTLIQGYAVGIGNENGVRAPYSFALGNRNSITTNGQYSVALGCDNTIDNTYVFAFGHGLQIGNASTAENSVIIGQYNNYTVSSTSLHDHMFVIGNGSGSDDRSNAFRINSNGKVYTATNGNYNTSGADYSEFIKEWYDGNPNNEDRVGYMVTIGSDGYLHKANEGDYIIGITSGNPSIVGNADEDYYWKYERDEFNRVIYDDIEETTNISVKKIDDDGNIIFDEDGDPVYETVRRNVIKKVPRISSNYDPSLQSQYIERSSRPEWDYVGMRGIVPVRDDGTCIPRQFCKCGTDGIATKAETRGFDTFYVIERINEHVISVEIK